MTKPEIESFAAAAEAYLLADNDSHQQAAEVLLPILNKLCEKYNARMVKFAGWNFIPFPKPDGGTILYVFSDRDVIGVAALKGLDSPKLPKDGI
jgi:hypothetical protein